MSTIVQRMCHVIQREKLDRGRHEVQTCARSMSKGGCMDAFLPSLAAPPSFSLSLTLSSLLFHCISPFSLCLSCFILDVSNPLIPYHLHCQASPSTYLLSNTFVHTSGQFHFPSVLFGHMNWYSAFQTFWKQIKRHNTYLPFLFFPPSSSHFLTLSSFVLVSSFLSCSLARFLLYNSLNDLRMSVDQQ